MTQGAAGERAGKDARWTHKGEADHEADPHYNVTGQPAYWVCYVKDCWQPLLLDGAKPPVTVPVVKGDATGEPPLSSQP